MMTNNPIDVNSLNNMQKFNSLSEDKEKFFIAHLRQDAKKRRPHLDSNHDLRNNIIIILGMLAVDVFCLGIVVYLWKIG